MFYEWKTKTKQNKTKNKQTNKQNKTKNKTKQTKTENNIFLFLWTHISSERSIINAHQ